ncbi:unnamed protein product [Owenia fusiformis]|uniref:Alpha-galactosidase n=1 Tax=Owenia fusiformis TaxID=6347 RepID=A0A8J1XJJ3_OWEFU|nr:unnamed protein product [Owenia fusiformis]
MSSYKDSDHFDTNLAYQRRKHSPRCLIITGVIVTIVVIAAVVVGVVFAVLPHTATSVVTAATPPMGWNTWNRFKCSFTENIVRETVNRMLELRLVRLGYNHIVLDECWQYKRNSSGHIQPDPLRLPNGATGMKTLADYLNSRGLKLGLSTSVGTLTCFRRPGSYSKETIDAATYKSWSVDYVKSADCFTHPGTYSYNNYIAMSRALRQTNQNIAFSVGPTISAQGAKDIAIARQVGNDNVDDFDLMLSIVDRLVEEGLAREAGTGFWNDLGMLQVGNGKMSTSEYRIHMSLWSALKSPLFLGNDLRTMSQAVEDIIQNSDIIAINQDPLGISANLIYSEIPFDGISKVQIVSKMCASTTFSQNFLFDSLRKRIHYYPDSSKCLTMETTYRYVTLRSCKNDTIDVNQQWFINTQTGTIHQENNRGNCITTSTIARSPAKVRSCNERNNTAEYIGPNEWWHPFNDVFYFDGDLTASFSIRNTNNMCASLGAVDDIQIYSGPLSNNNRVAILLNRDVTERSITLRWQDMGVSPGQQYQTRDVWTKSYAGDYKQTYSASVKPHDLVMLYMRAV